MEPTEYDWMYTKLDGGGIIMPARYRLDVFSECVFDEDQLRDSIRQFCNALVIAIWEQLREVEHNIHTEKCQRFLADVFKYVLNDMSSATSEQQYAVSEDFDTPTFETILKAWKSVIDQFMCDSSWYETIGMGASGMLNVELRISEGLTIKLKDEGSLPLTTLFDTTNIETSEYPQPLWYHINTLFFNTVKDKIEPEYREILLDYPWFEPQKYLWNSILNVLTSLTNMCLMGRTADVSQALGHRAEVQLGFVPIWQLTPETKEVLDMGRLIEESNMEEKLASVLEKYQRPDGLEQLAELAENLKLKDMSMQLNQSVKKLMKARQRELEEERAKLRKIFECFICNNVEKNLAALPCGHTLCMSCLSNMPTSKMLCPECRKKPDAGNIQANIVLKNVAEVLHIEESKAIEKQAANRFKNKVKRLEEWKNESAAKLLTKWETDFTSIDVSPENLEENLRKLEIEFKEKMEKLRENITNCVAHRREQAVEDIDRLKGTIEQAEKLCDYKTTRLQKTEEQLNEEVDRLIGISEQPPYAETEGNGLKPGASVRIKLSQIKYDFDILKVSHIVNETGMLIKSDESKNLADVLFPSYNAWVGKLDWLEVSPEPYRGMKVGDHVKIRLPEGRTEPHHGWGSLSTSKDNFGKIVKFTSIMGVVNPPPAPERRLDVSFPEDDDWTALLSELELYDVPPPSFEVGTKVWMIQAKEQIGWDAVGVVVSCDNETHVARVKFERIEDEWVGPVTDIEEIREVIQVGDLVKVKDSITEPRTNWGGVSHDDIGKVKKLDTDKDGMMLARVDFPNRLRLWNCHSDQLEIVRGRKARGGRDVGSGSTGLDLGGMLSGLGGLAELAQAISTD